MMPRPIKIVLDTNIFYLSVFSYEECGKAENQSHSEKESYERQQQAVFEIVRLCERDILKPILYPSKNSQKGKRGLVEELFLAEPLRKKKSELSKIWGKAKFGYRWLAINNSAKTVFCTEYERTTGNLFYPSSVTGLIPDFNEDARHALVAIVANIPYFITCDERLIRRVESWKNIQFKTRFLLPDAFLCVPQIKKLSTF